MQPALRTKEAASSAHDRVYRRLRTRIMHGDIAPGTALTLRGIGKQYDVSMTPAREAVRTPRASTSSTVRPSTRSSRRSCAICDEPRMCRMRWWHEPA